MPGKEGKTVEQKNPHNKKIIKQNRKKHKKNPIQPQKNNNKCKAERGRRRRSGEREREERTEDRGKEEEF